MVVIAGGTVAGGSVSGGSVAGGSAAEVSASDPEVRGSSAVDVPSFPAVEPGTSEARVVAGLLDCVARWGLHKTTIEDVARAAGLSRATVYRLFPGGKQAIVEAAALNELARLVDSVGGRVDEATTLADAVTTAVWAGSAFLAGNAAFDFLRRHEPDALQGALALERLDHILLTAAALLAPSLERFLAPRDAFEVGVWGARVVLSYLATPAPGVDLAREADARRLVTTYLLPGLPAASLEPTQH